VCLDAGEGQEEVVDTFIRAALSYYGEKGQLDNTPLPLSLERDRDARLTSSPLRYPALSTSTLAATKGGNGGHRA